MKKILFFITLTLFFNNFLVKSELLDIYIVPDHQTNNNSYGNLSAGFDFVKEKASSKDLQANIWLSSGNIFNFPDNADFKNIKQIMFSTYNKNMSNLTEKATILFDSFSKCQFSSLDLTINNTNLFFNESTNNISFNGGKINFTLVTISANATKSQNSLFYIANSTNIIMENVVIFNSNIKKNPIFSFSTDLMTEFSLNAEKLFISNNYFDTASVFQFDFQGFYSINLTNSIFKNSSFISSQVFEIKKTAKTITSDLLFIQNLFVKNLAFLSDSYFIFLQKMKETSSQIPNFTSNFTNFYFFNNTIVNSSFFYSKNNNENECIFQSFLKNIVVDSNNFSNGTFLKIPFFKFTLIKCIFNEFRNQGSFLENSFNKKCTQNVENILNLNDSVFVENSFFENSSSFSEKSLITIQCTRSVIIKNLSFIKHKNKGFLLSFIRNKLLDFQNCTFSDSFHRFIIYIELVESICIIDTLFKNVNQSINNILEWDSPAGGCISARGFTNVTVQRLNFSSLTAINTHLFELVNDFSEEIILFEISDSVISDNYIFSFLYEVYIWSFRIAQNSQSEFIFRNNYFFFNSLSSYISNQSNYAICFLSLPFNSIRIENIQFIGQHSQIFQSSLLEIKALTIILKNSSFGDETKNNNPNTKIQFFAKNIKIYDCKFYHLKELFVGGLNWNSQILINNSEFMENGRSITFNEPNSFNNITLEYCNFSNINQTNTGRHLHFQNHYNDLNLVFSINFCNFSFTDKLSLIRFAIFFSNEGNFLLNISNTVFDQINAKIKIKGKKNANQTIIFNNTVYSNSEILYIDASSNIPIALSKVSQYLNGIEIYNVTNIFFENAAFKNIYLNIHSFLDLTSFIIIDGVDQCKLTKVTFSNFSIIQNYDSFVSNSYIGIISFFLRENSKAIFNNTVFEYLNFDYNFEMHQMFYKGGAILLVNGHLDINNTNFSTSSSFGSCIYSLLNGSTIVNNSVFHRTWKSANIAFIDEGNFNFINSNISFNANNDNIMMIKTKGKGNISISDNHFVIKFDSTQKMKGIVNFNFEDIFVYGCNQSSHQNNENYFFQNLSCSKLERFSQDIKLILKKKINYNYSIEYREALDQFAIGISEPLYIPKETIDLEITKKSQDKNDTTIIFSRNDFDLSFIQETENKTKNEIFLIGYYDSQSKINANIKTKIDSVEHNSKQKFLIGIEIKQCPTGSYYNESNQNCTKCSSGTYLIDPVKDKCKPCPSFGNCFDGILQPKPNYWRPNRLSSNLYFCKINPSNCKGGINSECNNGSFGPKCESCDYSSNYVRKLNHQCAKCDDIGMLDSLFGLFIFFVQMIYLIVSTYSWYNTIELTKNNENQLEDRELVKHKKRISIYIDIFSNYFQIISLISSLKTNKISDSIYHILNLAIPTAILDSKYCLFLKINKLNTVYIDLIFIITLPFLKLFVFYIFWMILKKKCKSIKINKNHFILGLICIYRFEVIGQAFELFSYVSCEQINGEFYMIKDPQFKCDITDYSSIYFISFCTIMIPFLIIWVIVLPAWIFYSLTRKQNQDFLEAETLERYGVLYIGYKREFYYWEFLKLLTKILFIFVAKLVLFDPAKILLIIIIFCTYALALTEFKPYAHKHFNRVEIYATIVYIASFLIFIYGEYSILFGRLDNTYDANNRIVENNGYVFLAIDILINAIFTMYLLFKMIFALKKKILKYYLKASANNQIVEKCGYVFLAIDILINPIFTMYLHFKKKILKYYLKAKDFFKRYFEKKEEIKKKQKLSDYSLKSIDPDDVPRFSTNAENLLKICEKNPQVQEKNDSI